MYFSHVTHDQGDGGPVIASCSSAHPWGHGMDYDQDKVDEMVLALLWLTQTGDGRAWKGHDWDAMDRLYRKGMIDNPRSRAKSVVLTEEGLAASERLFAKLFGKGGASPGQPP